MAGAVHGMLAGVGAGYGLTNVAMSSFDLAVDPANASAAITFINGTASDTSGVSTTVSFGDPADLEVTRTAGTGDAPTGPAAGVYTALSTGTGWSLSQTSVGTKDWDGNYTIRVIATGQVLGGGTMSLSVTVDI